MNLEDAGLTAELNADGQRERFVDETINTEESFNELDVDVDDDMFDVANSSSLEKLNAEKATELSTIEVEIKKGVLLDGDKDSEENIKTALLVLDEDETTHWLTVSNEMIEVNREDLRKALRLIGEKKREIVFRYRTLKDNLESE